MANPSTPDTKNEGQVSPPASPNPPAKPVSPNPMDADVGAEPTQQRPIDDELGELFADKDDNQPRGIEPPAATDTKPAATDTKPAATDTKPEFAAPKDKPGEAKPVEGDDFLGLEEPQPKKEIHKEPNEKNPKELRDAYHRTKSRVAELEQELTETKTKSLDDGERKTFTEQIDTLNKKLEEQAGLIKTAIYEQSDEYREKYEEPFVVAWERGVKQVTQFDIDDEAGATRKGTTQDFEAIMREPDDQRAARLASEMFGPNSFYVLASRRDIQQAHMARNSALEKYRKTHVERTKAEAENFAKTQKEREQAQVQAANQFRALNEAAANKFPEIFAPIEGDEEGNKLLAKGIQEADLAFSGAPGLDPAKRIRLHSAIRNKAAAFNRLHYLAKQKDTRIAELEKELAEIRGSTPGDGKVAGTNDGKPKSLSADEEFEAIANRNR